jgi:hypothetical protein
LDLWSLLLSESDEHDNCSGLLRFRSVDDISEMAMSLSATT